MRPKESCPSCNQNSRWVHRLSPNPDPKKRPRVKVMESAFLLGSAVWIKRFVGPYSDHTPNQRLLFSRQDAKKTFLILLLCVLCAFARGSSHPIPNSYRAKTPSPQRMKSGFRASIFVCSWRPLRLCARSEEFSGLTNFSKRVTGATPIPYNFARCPCRNEKS
jgi:hypothetical protein